MWILVKLLSFLNLIFAIACLNILSWLDYLWVLSLTMSLSLFFLNTKLLILSDEEHFNINSNLILNTISVALILWKFL